MKSGLPEIEGHPLVFNCPRDIVSKNLALKGIFVLLFP